MTKQIASFENRIAQKTMGLPFLLGKPIAALKGSDRAPWNAMPQATAERIKAALAIRALSCYNESRNGFPSHKTKGTESVGRRSFKSAVLPGGTEAGKAAAPLLQGKKVFRKPCPLKPVFLPAVHHRRRG